MVETRRKLSEVWREWVASKIVREKKIPLSYRSSKVSRCWHPVFVLASDAHQCTYKTGGAAIYGVGPVLGRPLWLV